MFLKDAVLAYLNKLYLKKGGLKVSFNPKLSPKKQKKLKKIVKNLPIDKKKEIPPGTQLELFNKNPIKTVQPKTVQPKTVQPKTIQPKTVQPKTVQPKTVQPKPSKKQDKIKNNKPDTSKPDMIDQDDNKITLPPTSKDLSQLTEKQKKKFKEEKDEYLKNVIQNYNEKQIEKLIRDTHDEETLQMIALEYQKGDVEARMKALEKYYRINKKDLEWVKKFFYNEVNIKAKEMALDILKKDQKFLKDVWSENKTKPIGAYAIDLITDFKYLKEIVLQKSSPKTVRNVLETIEDETTLKQLYYQTDDPEVEKYIEKKLELNKVAKKILAKVKERLK